jgi:hypothetical protein
MTDYLANEIPNEIIKTINKINPTISNPIDNSIIYTISENDIYEINDNEILYKIPFSENTNWTHIKCITTEYENHFNPEIILITDDNYTYNIKCYQQENISKLYNLVWPLPSLKTGHTTGLFIKINYTSRLNIRIKLFGTLNLFPSYKYYTLNSNTISQFIIYKNKQSSGFDTIYNVEHPDYINNILSQSYTIYESDTY